MLYFLNISVAQPEAVIQLNTVGDDFPQERVAGVSVTYRLSATHLRKNSHSR
jgi:single-stranded DNA-specific DHH superfamily exonuclease